MIDSIHLKSIEELILLHHQTNRELTCYLLDGASWEEQHDRIILLTKLSKELSSRNIEIRQNQTVRIGK